jgi:hypothetical protein
MPPVNKRNRLYRKNIINSFYPSIRRQIEPILLSDLNLQKMNDALSTYEQAILDIIQYIIDRINLDTVVRYLEDLITDMNNTTDYDNVGKTITTIEDTILSIMGNITNKVPFNIISSRIAYLQEIISITDDPQSSIDEIQDIILNIIQIIINKENLDNVLIQLESISAYMESITKPNIIIKNIENIILSIIENIIKRVPLTIVRDRFIYLQQQVNDLTSIMNST